MTRRKDSLVTFKTCFRCKGTGQVPCDGNEHVRIEQKLWADGFNLKPVTFKLSAWDGTVVAGIAVPMLLPGGYHNLKIYVKASDPPNAYGYTYINLPGGKIDGLFHVGKKALFQFDIINGKAFWPVVCRYEDRQDLCLLDTWPESIAIEDIKQLGLSNTSV
jgi:hypothetical protein